MAEQARAQWKSKFGFILAASGSAIGLGNIVFFPANAYKYGGGAFYVPYLIALFVIGIPVMITEFGLGASERKSFPLAMRKAGGTAGEFVGWLAIINAGFISLYYITILGWVIGMGAGAIGDSIFSGTTDVAWVGSSGAELPNPTGYFFHMISTGWPILFVVIVWGLNWLLVSKGTETIEGAVKVFVPLMWFAMLALVVVGVLVLPGGFEGVKFLFTPKTEVLFNGLEVWQGAMSQMFFTLTLGFGVMTAYASYLPKNSDHSHNAITTSLLNCGFEWIAGVAIFAILFSFSISPKASTLAMMFFIVPKGIGEMGALHYTFGVGFFILLLIAGLTSSISLVEALVSAAGDKFKARRKKTLTIACIVGAIGSMAFALPTIVNKGLEDDGTLGLTLLDLIDHWAFSYGLLIVGLLECLIIGWGMGIHKLREQINSTSKVRLGEWFDWLIKLVIPAIIVFVLTYNIINGEMGDNGLYGKKYVPHYTTSEGSLLDSVMKNSHWLALVVWLFGVIGVSLVLTMARAENSQTEEGVA